jgi:TPR repeat protein
MESVFDDPLPGRALISPPPAPVTPSATASTSPATSNPRRRWSNLARAGICMAVVILALMVWTSVSPFRRSYALAILGRPTAQYTLAAHYKSGLATTPDFGKAARWYKRSADKGLPQAHFEYGVLRLNGLGVDVDRNDALVHIRKAAEAGVVEAQFLLATQLLSHVPIGAWVMRNGSPQFVSGGEVGGASPGEAEKWLRAAAEAGYLPAEWALANEYIAGSMLPENFEAADILLKDLADRGFEAAKARHAELIDYLMTPAQRSVSERRWASHPTQQKSDDGGKR